jgi:hypothetical protein
LKTEKIVLEKPELTDVSLYEYAAEIVGAQLIIYKENKEIHKVTISGQTEGEVKVTNVYKIDDETYYKVLVDPQRKISVYVRVNSENKAEIY